MDLGGVEREGAAVPGHPGPGPKPLVRPIRFHSLRHTTATLLLSAGAGLAAVQRIMRHRDPRVTMERYAHLAPDFLRAEIDRLTFEPKVTASPTAQAPEVVAGAVNSPPFVPRLSPELRQRLETESPGSATARNRGFIPERRTGIEPATPSLGSSCSAS